MSMSSDSIVMSTSLCVLRAHHVWHISRLPSSPPPYSNASSNKSASYKKSVRTQIQIVKRVVIICTERSKIENVRMVVTVVVALIIVLALIDLGTDDNTVAAGLLLLVDVFVLGAALVRLVGERAAGTSAVELDAVTLACDSVALACAA